MKKRLYKSDENKMLCGVCGVADKLRDDTADFPTVKAMAEAAAGSDFPRKKAGI